MNRIKRTSIGILITLLMAAPFASQVAASTEPVASQTQASSCSWFDWSSCSDSITNSTIFNAVMMN